MVPLLELGCGSLLCEEPYTPIMGELSRCTQYHPGAFEKGELLYFVHPLSLPEAGEKTTHAAAPQASATVKNF